MRPKFSEHKFLEDEEADYEALRRREPDPTEERGLAPLAGGVARALAVAGAAFDMAPKTESPIEATLGARLSLAIDIWNKDCEPKLTLVPQYQIKRFRYDFAILAGDRLVLAIECDGKDFHSSESQRANDAAKDALVRSIGADVTRFTGSKIFRDDAACVEKIMFLLCKKYGIQ